MSDNTQALQVFTFEGHELRTVMHNDEPWWIASDVCTVLGLSNVSLAVNGNEKTGDLGLDDDEKLMLGILISGQTRSVVCVNEPGLYALIRKSRKPQAKAFDRWIRHEVIPSIRKTGSYSIYQDDNPLQGMDAILSDANRLDLLIKGLQEVQQGQQISKQGEQKIYAVFYPEKQQSPTTSIKSKSAIEKPAPTPEYIQAEILRHMDRLSASGKTSLSVTDIKNYMPHYTRTQLEAQCRNLVEQGVLQAVHTSHTVKYECVGKEI